MVRTEANELSGIVIMHTEIVIDPEDIRFERSINANQAAQVFMVALIKRTGAHATFDAIVAYHGLPSCPGRLRCPEITMPTIPIS